ncbi:MULTISPECIES: fimbrial protein [unclassified Serratia (in: enterobacteria)]|uniref:fimbrial protein n=1 Tax=unclassified Serratia (in: enterobacteria) TaxID=2647522 RepID=UPI0018ABAEA9
MKLNILALVVAAGFMSNAFAVATEAGKGQIKFTGSIIEAPCSITPGTSNQNIELGQVSATALKDGGKSTPVTFQIDLEKCDIAGITKGVTATFTGPASASNTDLLGITGSAKGASIVLTDGAGTPIKFGTPTSPQLIMGGSNTLAFSAYLQGDTDPTAVITPGEFTSIANYALAYE